MSFDNVLPGLVIAVYLLIELCKVTFLKTPESRKHIPLIAGIIGVVAAVCIYIFAPEIIYASNVLEAIATGGLSGFAATGCNQLFKKYFNFKGNNGSSNTNSGEGF